jgi:hypothetical protein
VANQLNVTTNLVNNIVYQPTYAGTSKENVYLCGGGALGTVSGSNNIWYSVSAPGSTGKATSIGAIENPLFVSTTTPILSLLSTSPAIGAGSTLLFSLLDFNGVTRPSPPSIGAYEDVTTTSQTQVTLNAAETDGSAGQLVVLTAAVAEIGDSIPTGTITFSNNGVALGVATLNNEGAAGLSLPGLTPGSYSITAEYSGDSNYAPAESAPYSLQVP